jgi:LPXTG-site transpeptidase (sortase) family protein
LKVRQFFPALVLLAFLTFLIWLLLVFLPVVWIELKYQFKSFFQNRGIDNPQALFFPDFSGMTIVGNASKNKDYGIVIPRLGLDEKVVFNVDPNDEQQYKAALKQGIAHASSTNYPDQKGLGYYFAHSSSPGFQVQYNAVFYLLNKLETGDEIYIWHERKRYRYLVTEKRISQATDTTFLYQTYEGENIVLQTCWPPGTTKERLLVFAQRAN